MNDHRIALARSVVPSWGHGVAAGKCGCDARVEFTVESIAGGLTNVLSVVRRKPCSCNSNNAALLLLEGGDVDCCGCCYHCYGDGEGSGGLPAAKRGKVAEVACSGSCQKEIVTAVLVREYGPGTDLLISRKDEEIIAQALSSSGISPRVFGTFRQGRAEEFFENSHSLKCSDLQDPEILKGIGELIANFHSSKVEGIARSDQLSLRFEKWWCEAAKIALRFNKFESCSESLQKSKTEDVSKEVRHERKLAAFDLTSLRQEITWLLKVAIPQVTASLPLVFCHNDLQEGNILKNQYSHNLRLIDFEYAGYGYRGFDFGNLFCEMTLDYQISGFPGFVCHPDKYPTSELQEIFFKSYISTWNHVQQKKQQGNMKGDIYCQQQQLEEAQLQAMKKEAEVFELASHLIWTLWSIIQSEVCGNSHPSFGYLEYGHTRLDQYFARKQKFWNDAKP